MIHPTFIAYFSNKYLDYTEYILSSAVELSTRLPHNIRLGPLGNSESQQSREHSEVVCNDASENYITEHLLDLSKLLRLNYFTFTTSGEDELFDDDRDRCLLFLSLLLLFDYLFLSLTLLTIAPL